MRCRGSDGLSATAQPRTILYLHSSAGLYGADRQLLLLATGLDPERYRPLVVLPEAGELAVALREAGVEVLLRPLAVLRRALMTPAGLGRVGAAWAADAGGLGRLARSRGVALVHTNTSVTLGGAAAARIAGVPHVWHVREIYAGFERWWPAYRRLLTSADALPCVSAAVAAQFDGYGAAGADAGVGVGGHGLADRQAGETLGGRLARTKPAADVEVIHDGLAGSPRRAPRMAARSALDLDDDAFAVAVLGRISTWKGQELLVRAIATQPGAVALIAGRAWRGEERLERELVQLARALDCEDRVRMLGFCPDISDVLGAADVVAVPSTSPDPLPNAALEAAAAGCCVVAADHGGLPEILSDGATGVLFGPGDGAALAGALRALAADPAERERLGTAAAVDVGGRFSPHRALSQVQGLYDGLLD